MNPRIEQVWALEEYKLKLLFTNNECKIFDATPYLEFGQFKTLKDKAVFNSVKPFMGSIQWENGLDLCPDTLYLESVVPSNLEFSNSH